MRALLIIAAVFVSTLAQAQNGADVLLQKTGTVVEENKTGMTTADSSQFKLNDPFLQHLFAEWRGAGPQSFDVNHWVGLVLSHDFTGAAHLWTSIQSQMPVALQGVAQQTWTYLAWRLKLPQTFLQAWRDSKALSGAERGAIALEQVITAEAGTKWVVEQRPFIDPVFARELLTGPRVGFDLELAAWAARYDSAEAGKILAELPMGHPLALDLARTAVLALARKGEIGEAGKLLKRRVEPELEKRGDAKELSGHYLTLGRLLYQAGALEASEAFYARIPRGVPEFIPARTERTWALLRLNRVGDLKGELASLSHQVFADRFLPEVGLVRAISNLKLCRYDDVAADFSAFISANRKWARTITSALADPAKSKVDATDVRVPVLQESLKLRASEDQKLAKLAKQSIQATLPAVGEQPHWVKARQNLAQTREGLNSQLVAQKQRFWKNRETILTETIRKMKFVRVEAMSQVRMAAGSSESQDVVAQVQAAPHKGEQTYPVDGVYWPDELFKLHARAQTRCGVK